MIDLVFEASIADVLDDHLSDERLKTALFGQGIIGTWGGPRDPGTASIKLMHFQGDMGGQGPLWGYVEGGMGMVSFAIADAAREAGAVLACGVPVSEIVPGEGVTLEDGTSIRAGTVICNADPKRMLDMLDGQDVDAAFRERLERWKVRSPVVKFNAALERLPTGPPPRASRGPRARRSTSPARSTTPSAPSRPPSAASRRSPSARSTSRPATTPARPPRASTC